MDRRPATMKSIVEIEDQELEEIRSRASNSLDEVVALFQLGLERGADVVKILYGGQPTLLVNDPKLVQAILHDKAFPKDPQYMNVLKPLHGDGLVTSQGAKKKRLRKAMQQSFNHDMIQNLSQLFVQETERMCERWNHDYPNPCDTTKEMTGLTLDIIIKSVFGPEIDTQPLRKIGDVFTKVNKALGSVIMSLGSPSTKLDELHGTYTNAVKDLDEVIYDSIKEHKESGAFDLVSGLKKNFGSDTTAIRNEIVTMLVAGHETTAVALSWILYRLDSNPDVYEKLLHEVDTVLDGRSPTVSDYKSLTYTGKVINETLRLDPPGWIMAQRVAVEKKEVAGYEIPQGIKIKIVPYTLHRHPDYWKNPEMFNPDRSQKHSIPFGVGPNACIGKHFAELELRMILTTLSQRYTLQLEPGQDIVPEPFFTLKPPERGIMMSYKSRER